MALSKALYTRRWMWWRKPKPMRALDGVDVLIMYADMLPFEQALGLIQRLFDYGADYKKHINHPSVRWWVAKNAAAVVAHYTERAS